MKFKCTVTIEQPISKVIRLFDDPANLKEWQDGFISTTVISGKKGTKGAKSLIKIKAGNNIVELTETILVKNLPQELNALYEHKHMDNIVVHRFVPVTANSTQWTSEIEYIRFKEWIPRLMASLFPGMFRKQTQKWLENFKKFAERN